VGTSQIQRLVIAKEILMGRDVAEPTSEADAADKQAQESEASQAEQAPATV
jgi:hypothetical protein